MRGNNFPFNFSVFVPPLFQTPWLVGSTSAPLLFQPSGQYTHENPIFPPMDECHDFFSRPWISEIGFFSRTWISAIGFFSCTWMKDELFSS
jgi:hypothetical protein